MATDCISQTTFRFQQNSKPVLARFDVAHASSDGGAVLLKAIDAQLRLTEQLADTLRDPGQSGKIRHQGIELLRQRVFGVACGYADCNDAARLADDPIHKLLVDRDPLTGAALGSQPTLSRFENGVRRGALYALGEALADTVIASHQRRLTRRPVRRITIDLDPTDDPTHGQQELAFFNGHYDTWCYLPLIGTLTFNAEPIQYLVAAPCCGRARGRPRGGPSGCCVACSPSCAPPSLRRGCACAWTGALPAIRSWTSWRPSGSSTSSGWPAMRAWSSGSGA